MKSKFLLILLIILAAKSAFSQQTGIQGVVKDFESGETLVGVTVYIDSLQTGTTTDSRGQYQLSLPSGKYKIQFSFVGYITDKQVVTINESIKKLNIRLQIDNKMLDEVVISSQRRDANVTEMAMSVEKLEMIKIRKIPSLMGEVDVIKAIQLLPGVQAASEGSSGYSIRGGSTDQNLILLDDAPIYNASHFLGFFSVFNNDVVKDATLYKGDFPANYDSRLSSVLDVKTHDEIPDRFTMTGGIGILTSRLMINLPFNKQRTSVMLAGRVTYGGLMVPLLSEQLKGTRLYFYDLNGKIIHVFNENNRLFISGYHGKDKFSIDNLAGIGYGNTSLTTRWNHIFNDNLTSNLSFLYTDYKYIVNIMMKPYNFDLTAGIKDYTAKYDFSYLWNENITSRFGISATYHRYLQGELNDKTGAVSMYMNWDTDESAERKALEYALYFSNDHNITPLFSIRYGVRLSVFQNIGEEDLYLFDDKYDYYDSIHYDKNKIFNTEFHFEPRLALKYQLDEVSSVKASYSRTVQYAQLAANSTGGLPIDMWFPTNPNIKPQKCDQFALGYFRNFRHDEIETSVEVFYKHLTDVIDFKDDAFLYGNLLIDGEVRVGKGRSYGAEFMIRKNYGKLTGWLAYTYSRSFRTINEINFGNEYVSPFDRPHNLSIVLNYAFNKRFDISANWVYNTGQPVTNPYGKYSVNGNTYAIYNGSRNMSRYPDYHRLDFSAMWKRKNDNKRWQDEWNISIYNVYSRHNTWAVLFNKGENNTLVTEKMYLFTIIPSVSYNFKF